MSSANTRKVKKHSYLDDGEVYRDMVECSPDLEEDIPELDNANTAKSELKVIADKRNEETKDITA
ncbi:MAG: hypothetical protein ACYC0V_02955 [Armatimonadota bacterium]